MRYLILFILAFYSNVELNGQNEALDKAVQQVVRAFEEKDSSLIRKMIEIPEPTIPQAMLDTLSAENKEAVMKMFDPKTQAQAIMTMFQFAVYKYEIFNCHTPLDNLEYSVDTIPMLPDTNIIQVKIPEPRERWLIFAFAEKEGNYSLYAPMFKLADEKEDLSK